MKVWCATVAMAAVVIPSSALAADVQFCIEITTSFTDSSWTEGSQTPDWSLAVFPTPASPVTEDYWTTKVFERPPRGAKYVVKRNAVQVKQGYLGDGYDANKPPGCTDNITGVNLLGSWTIDVTSEGVVQNNYVYSYDHTKNPRTMSSLYLGYNPPAGRNATVQYPESSDPVTADVMTGFFAASFALYRHAGGEVNNKYYLYRCVCDSNCVNIATQTGSCGCSGEAPNCAVGGNDSSAFWDGWRVSSMTPSGLHRKFTVVHELGHAIATTISNNKPNGGDYDDNDSDADCSNPQAWQHAFWSRETQKCAFGEGYANFYSADVWNTHGQKDCAYKYYKTNGNTTYPYDRSPLTGAAFDCAGDDGADADASRDDFTNGQSVNGVPFLNNCSGSPYAGKATELDYTRVLWNVHTDGNTQPTFTDIAGWIGNCGGGTPLGNLTTYTQLDACAETRNDSLEANWDANKTAHNVDNPAP